LDQNVKGDSEDGNMLNDYSLPYVSNTKRAKQDRSELSRSNKETKKEFLDTMKAYILKSEAHMDNTEKHMAISDEKYDKRTKEIAKFGKVASMRLRLDIAIRRGDNNMVDEIMKDLQDIESSE
jgi:hypothetical protein